MGVQSPTREELSDVAFDVVDMFKVGDVDADTLL